MYTAMLTTVLAILKYVNRHVHYSLLSFMFLIASRHMGRTWHMLGVNNSIGMSCTWYWAVAIDPSLPRRMMTKYEWSLSKYIIGDAILHTLPLLYSITQTYNSFSQNVYERHRGLYTLLANMLWSVCSFGGFEPTEGYVEQHWRTWNLIWFGNAMAHLIPMIIT
jgi:hypothetical protein